MSRRHALRVVRSDGERQGHTGSHGVTGGDGGVTVSTEAGHRERMVTEGRDSQPRGGSQSISAESDRQVHCQPRG